MIAVILISSFVLHSSALYLALCNARMCCRCSNFLIRVLCLLYKVNTWCENRDSSVGRYIWPTMCGTLIFWHDFVCTKGKETTFYSQHAGSRKKWAPFSSSLLTILSTKMNDAPLTQQTHLLIKRSYFTNIWRQFPMNLGHKFYCHLLLAARWFSKFKQDAKSVMRSIGMWFIACDNFWLNGWI